MTKKHGCSSMVAVFIHRNGPTVLQLDHLCLRAYHSEQPTILCPPLLVERPVAKQTESIFISYYLL